MHPQLLQTALKVKSYVVGTAYNLFVSMYGVSIHRNVAYGAHPCNSLDIYNRQLDGRTKLKQVIVVVHGGGWIAGDKRERALFCAALAKEGYVVFNMNYRLAPQCPFPGAVDDCIEAIHWVSAHAREYDANPQHISVVGDSAGTHIASLAVTSPITRRHIEKLILYYGIYNLETVQHVRRPFMQTYLRALTGSNDAPSLTGVSPILHVQNFPPTLLIASEKDPLHTQTTELAQAMKKVGKERTVMLFNKRSYPHANHGFQNLPYSNAGRKSFKAVLDFLKK